MQVNLAGGQMRDMSSNAIVFSVITVFQRPGSHLRAVPGTGTVPSQRYSAAPAARLYNRPTVNGRIQRTHPTATSTSTYNGLFEETVFERPTVMVAVENSNSCGR